ncbi:MAG: Lipopolysaccharide assembly protein B [Candidatus Anoxychlamydiales bacterium]|nr:Lipopolysaccharide assembly protein B [Candidatus Anoxychlamydiales bacterium]
MIDFSIVFAQYRSFDEIYVFKNEKDSESQVTLEVYDLALNRLRTRPVTVRTLTDVYHLPEKEMGTNVEECVLKLLKEGYFPTIDGWSSFVFKSDLSIMDFSSMPDVNKVILHFEKQIEKKHWDDIEIPEYNCPVTCCKMEDPTITGCGHTFEVAPAHYLAANEKDCPICREPLKQEDLRLNRALKDAITLRKKELQISTLVPSLKLFKGKNDEELADFLFKRSQGFLTRHEFDEALDSNIQAIWYSTNSDYYAQIPLIFKRKGEKLKACLAYLYLSTYQSSLIDSLASLRKAAELQPNNAELSFVLARAYKKNDNRGEALFFYRKAAEAFLAKKEKNEAIKCYKEILYVEPSNFEIYNLLADLYDGNKEKAHIYLKGALHFITQKAFYEAETLCIKAKTCCSESFLSHQPYLELLQQEGKEEDLIQVCMKLAKDFEDVNADDDAIACYGKVISIRPSYEAYERLISLIGRREDKYPLLFKYIEWISFCIENESWKEAEVITKEAVSRLGEDSLLLRKLKKIYKHISSHEIEPLLLRLGHAYNEKGVLEKAQKVYKTAWERFQNISASFSLASILIEKKMTVEALEVYKKLAELLYLKGNMQDLSKCITQIKSIDPNFDKFTPQEKMALLTQSYISNYAEQLQSTRKQLERTESQLQVTKKQLEKSIKRVNAIIITSNTYIKSVGSLNGHAAGVWALKNLPDDMLASGSFDHTIKIWKANNCVGTLEGHRSDVQCIEWLPSGFLVSGSDDHTIKVWNVNTKECIKTIKEHTGPVQGFELLSNNRLASVSSDKTIRIWDLDSGECIKVLKGHTHPIWSVKRISDKLLATGSSDTTIRIWNTDTYACTNTLQGHTGTVYSLESLPKGHFASGSFDRTIKIWDLNSGECIKVLTGHSSQIKTLKMLPNGQLVSGSSDKTIKFWDLYTGICIKTFKASSNVFSFEILPNKRFVYGLENGLIVILELPFL